MDVPTVRTVAMSQCLVWSRWGEGAPYTKTHKTVEQRHDQLTIITYDIITCIHYNYPGNGHLIEIDDSANS